MKSFKAYCKDEDGLFFWVKVYRTKKAMQAALRREHHTWKCDAMCADWVHQKWDGKRFKRMNDIGVLFFHHDSMRVGVICHEAFHAAIAWHRFVTDSKALKLERKKNGTVGDQEEDVSWVAGNLARQVVLGYRNKKARKHVRKAK